MSCIDGTACEKRMAQQHERGALNVSDGGTLCVRTVPISCAWAEAIQPRTQASGRKR